MAQDFQDLEIYKLAEDLILNIYKLTHKFPKEEVFGITSQVRRSVVSIALNISESSGRFHYKDKIVFLYHARGSLFETKSILSICTKLNFIEKSEQEEMAFYLEKLGVKLNNYISFLKKKHGTPTS